MNSFLNFHIINRKLLLPHIVRELEQLEEGLVYPLKAEYERVNNTLEGLRSGVVDDILELPADAGELHVVAKVPDGSDRWHNAGSHWFRIHLSRRMPSPEDGGPDVVVLSERRVTFRIFSGDVHDVVLDSWREVGAGVSDQLSWVGGLRSTRGVSHLGGKVLFCRPSTTQATPFGRELSLRFR